VRKTTEELPAGGSRTQPFVRPLSSVPAVCSRPTSRAPRITDRGTSVGNFRVAAFTHRR
jgi:hypothetical protein